MKMITVKAKECPIICEADVVVCGGGPGGLGAAIAAARLGKKVVLVERFGALGGLVTTGLVNTCMSAVWLSGDKMLTKVFLRNWLIAVWRRKGLFADMN